MGGGGHHHVPKLPDYRIYKVENIPELMMVKQALAAKGLKDPWLRNEVWKYEIKNRGTPGHVFRKTFGRGMAVGFGLAVLSAAVGLMQVDPHPHDHGSESEHDGGHH